MFDKVWHKGLLYKLEQKGISFLVSRKQKVVVNSQHLSWSNVIAGVPQGSILVPFLFPIYMEDLSDGLRWHAKLFTNDISLFSTVYDMKR